MKERSTNAIFKRRLAVGRLGVKAHGTGHATGSRAEVELAILARDRAVHRQMLASLATVMALSRGRELGLG